MDRIGLSAFLRLNLVFHIFAIGHFGCAIAGEVTSKQNSGYRILRTDLEENTEEWNTRIESMITTRQEDGYLCPFTSADILIVMDVSSDSMQTIEKDWLLK